MLEELSHRRLEQKPRNAQMLAILASSLNTGPLAVHGLGEPAALAEADDDVGAVDKPVNEVFFLREELKSLHIPPH